MLAAAGVLSLAAANAASAQVTFVAPQFVAERDTIGLAELATDPFGKLYATEGSYTASHLLKFQPDLTPVFDKTIGDGEPIASDSAGRLFVAGLSELRQYTSNGGLLGEWKISTGDKGGMSSDSTDHFYLPEFDGGAPVLNEYAVVAGTPTVVASTPYVGTPNDGFIPRTFFESAVDAERDVYASGATEGPDTRFIHRYGPGLSGAPFALRSCASPCGWASGLDVARLLAAGGGGADYLIADNYLSHTIQVYSTGAGGAPAGSFPIEVTPGSPSIVPVDFASSDCTGSLYILLTVFGGPGGTFSGSRIQRYDTGAATGPCPKPPLATISGLDKQVYKLVPKASAGVPCVPCVLLGKSGAEARARSAAASATRAQAGKRAKGGKGLKLRFETTSAADVSFLFRGPIEGAGKPKKRGGFLYAAGAGKNKLKFTGVLKKRKPLPTGTYKTTVSDAAGQTLEKFKTKVLES